MTHILSVAVPAQATFGRDGAMFEGLLDFVAQMSVVLWSLVILTAVMRFVGIRLYRRGGARRGLVEAAGPAAVTPIASGPVAVSTTPAGIDLVQPAAIQLADDGLGRLGLFGPLSGETDRVLVPGGQADSEFTDDPRTDAVTAPAFDAGLHPAETSAGGASARAHHHASARNQRAEPRSAAQVPALASNSTEA